MIHEPKHSEIRENLLVFNLANLPEISHERDLHNGARHPSP